MMKNVPRPTVSRITRIWLPGRARCSTAWRNAKTDDLANGAVLRVSAMPTRCSTTVRPANPTQTPNPMRSDAACHEASATSAPPTAIVAAI